MADETRVITILGTTYNHLEREIEKALTEVAPRTRP
jgi:hypothetical protein